MPCKEAKGNAPVEVFLADRPEVLERVREQLRRPLGDAASVNATRYAVGRVRQGLGLPVLASPAPRSRSRRD